MDEFGSFAGVIALWLGLSCGLWWLHRRSVHAKQRRQMRQAVRAVAYVADAQKIFDTIRVLPRAAATAAVLTAETHALLKRMQGRSVFFDKVNVLRVDMLAAFGMEDYPPLSEILHIRRDLWAASEILLVEDPSSFGESFAEEGAYERFRAEATALLFKTDSARPGEEDVIDLRLSLARGEAERLIPELKEAIRLARERDRMPTFAEVVAYPVGAVRALPRKLRRARSFLSEFYGYAAEVAGGIRRSEAMERGVSELRRAREELPQRLVTGFERASDAARQSATGLRRHYDFLVAAHDFQAKYEHTLRRAPQITERGRQFIARLELAEHSERLRLTSANIAIWLTRQLATGLAYVIAGLQRLHAVLTETPPGVLATALVAPTPIRGRHLPAFRSYHMALAMSGLLEPRPPLPVATERAVTPMERKKLAKSGAEITTSVQKEKGKRAKPAKAPKSAVVPPKAATKEAAGATATAPSLSKAKLPESSRIEARPPASVTSAAKSVLPASAPSKPGAGKTGAKIEARSIPENTANKNAASIITASPVETLPAAMPAKPAASSAAKQPVKEATRTSGKRDAEPEGKPSSEPPRVVSATTAVSTAKASPARLQPLAAKRNGAETVAVKSESAKQPDAPPPQADTPAPTPAESAPPQTASFQPEKRRSFLDRLLGRRPPEPTIGELLAAAWEREHADETGGKIVTAPPPETAPTLLAKLSELPAEDLPEADEDGGDSQDEPVEDDADDQIGDHPESLTSSVMEVQAKLASKPPQIRSFPWLRG